MRNILILTVLLAVAAGGAELYADVGVGDRAPEVKPGSWLRLDSTKTSWKALQGRVILLEKWSTG